LNEWLRNCGAKRVLIGARKGLFARSPFNCEVDVQVR
jgi:hypothetical protein